MFGKRRGGLLERVSATPTESDVTRVSSGIDPFEYLQMTFHVSEPLLRYFRIFIERHPLIALVDSGFSQIILGDEGTKIVRRLGLPTTRAKGFQIRTANGQIAEIAKEITLSLALENFCRRVMFVHYRIWQSHA